MSMRDMGFQHLAEAPADILGCEIVAGHSVGATERVTYQTKEDAAEAWRRGWVWWRRANTPTRER